MPTRPSPANQWPTGYHRDLTFIAKFPGEWIAIAGSPFRDGLRRPLTHYGILRKSVELFPDSGWPLGLAVLIKTHAIHFMRKPAPAGLRGWQLFMSLREKPPSAGQLLRRALQEPSSGG